jgi:ribosomal-protein-alanine N-acetyltransferase
VLSHKGTKAINTDRLLLRRFELDDAYNMFKNWANDSEVTKFLTWEPHSSIEVTKEIIDQWVNNYKDTKTYEWAIELKEIGEVIGSISIVKLDDKNYSCEIGYCMSRKYWGKGIMSESLEVVIHYLFSEIGFNRIFAKYDTNNVASGKVMLKCGMKYEGTLRQVKIRDNKEFYDLDIYAILKNDWLSESKPSS